MVSLKMKANIHNCKARQVLTWVLLLKGGVTSSPGRMKRGWQQRRARNKSRRQNSVSGTIFQAREQKPSPCIGGLYRSGFLFATRNSLHVRAYLVQFYTSWREDSWRDDWAEDTVFPKEVEEAYWQCIFLLPNGQISCCRNLDIFTVLSTSTG